MPGMTKLLDYTTFMQYQLTQLARSIYNNNNDRLMAFDPGQPG